MQLLCCLKRLAERLAWPNYEESCGRVHLTEQPGWLNDARCHALEATSCVPLGLQQDCRLQVYVSNDISILWDINGEEVDQAG